MKRSVTVLLLAVTACGGGDPIRELIGEVEMAAESRDASAVAEHLADTFRGSSGMTRSEVVSLLKRFMLAYETVALEVFDVEIERAGDRAQVRCWVEFSGQARRIAGLMPPAAVYRFEATLAQANGRWQLTEADWKAGRTN
jgi:hypothetical protein